MKYIRLSTRLFCDVYEGYRALTSDKKMDKWMKGMSIHFQIEEKLPYDKVIWKMEALQCFFEFNIMKAGQKTEYCTEIHLRILPIESSEIPEEKMTIWSKEGESILEVLRQYYNKDWVIQENDLSRDILKS